MAERRVAEAELQIVRQKTILDAMVRGNHSHRVIDQARSALARFEDKGSEAQDTPRVGFYMLCRRLPCASNRKSDKMVYDKRRRSQNPTDVTEALCVHEVAVMLVRFWRLSWVALVNHARIDFFKLQGVSKTEYQPKFILPCVAIELGCSNPVR
jgi:hypothetical protein